MSDLLEATRRTMREMMRRAAQPQPCPDHREVVSSTRYSFEVSRLGKQEADRWFIESQKIPLR